MDQKTADCLSKADANRDLAGELITSSLRSFPYDWVIVIAFYAAVHYVNAYLWENDNQYEPENHQDRSGKIYALPILYHVRDQYRRLNRLGFNARYRETVHFNRNAAQSALADLRDIEAQIRPHLS